MIQAATERTHTVTALGDSKLTKSLTLPQSTFVYLQPPPYLSWDPSQTFLKVPAILWATMLEFVTSVPFYR